MQVILTYIQMYTEIAGTLKAIRRRTNLAIYGNNKLLLGNFVVLLQSWTKIIETSHYKGKMDLLQTLPPLFNVESAIFSDPSTLKREKEGGEHYHLFGLSQNFCP